jgi:pimeloyl-ACP methyl ester carboxylesterase
MNTTCQSLQFIAEHLVRTGHRVLLFDFYGRGFSDAPVDVDHDAALYVYQAYTVLESASPPWTKPRSATEKVKVVGYSMGGAIAVHLVKSYPDLFESVALVAPAGLMRWDKISFPHHLLRSGWLPTWITNRVLAQKLMKPIGSSIKKGQLLTEDQATTPPDAPHPDSAEAKLEKRVREQTIWMVKNHAGFVSSVRSCMEKAPLMKQLPAFLALAKTEVDIGLFFGLHDNTNTSNPAEYEADGLRKTMMSVRTVHQFAWKTIPGAHDMSKTHPAELLWAMDAFWAGEHKKHII